MRQSEKGDKPQLSSDVRNVFTDAATRFPGDFAKQAQQIVRAHRPAGLPEQFQPRLMSQWDDLYAKRQQQERAQEAGKQNEAKQQANRELVERRNQERLAKRGRESCRELEQILRENQIDQLVNRAWGIANPSIEHNPDIVTFKDGTEENRSSVFISREYKYKYKGYVPGVSHPRSESGMNYPSSSGTYHKGETTTEDRAGVKFNSALSVWREYMFEQMGTKGESVWRDYVHGRINMPSGTDSEMMEKQQDVIVQNFKQGVKAYYVNVDGNGGFNKSVPIEHPQARQFLFEWVMAAEEIKKKR